MQRRSIYTGKKLNGEPEIRQLVRPGEHAVADVSLGQFADEMKVLMGF